MLLSNNIDMETFMLGSFCRRQET